MSDQAPESNNSKATKPIAPTGDSSTPIQNRSIKKILDDNIVWVLCGLAVGAFVAGVSAVNYIEERVDERVTQIVTMQVATVFYGDPWVKERHVAEVAARAAQDDAERAQQEAKQAQQNARAAELDAITSANNSRRRADELKSKANEIAGLIDLNKFRGEVDKAVQTPEIRNEIITKVLPLGAVIAFDTADGCPAGWTQFRDASGRVIVGAGQTANLDINGKPLSVRPFGTSGGEEQHLLTVDELPPHTHKYGPAPNFFNFANGGSNPKTLFGSINGPAVTAETQPAGNNHPHNIMPPYIALYYCQKAAN